MKNNPLVYIYIQFLGVIRINKDVVLGKINGLRVSGGK